MPAAVLQIIGLELERDQRLGAAEDGKAEVARHDADDRVRLAVQDERLAEHAAIAAELALPELIGDHDRARRALEIFLRREGAAQSGEDLEGREEARRHVGARDAHRTRVEGDVHLRRPDRGDRLE